MSKLLTAVKTKNKEKRIKIIEKRIELGKKKRRETSKKSTIN
jgi:hypothetical protein